MEPLCFRYDNKTGQEKNTGKEKGEDQIVMKMETETKMGIEMKLGMELGVEIQTDRIYTIVSLGKPLVFLFFI